MRIVSFAMLRVLNLGSLARLIGLSTLIFLFQSVCFGQVYSYSSLSQSGNSVIGYSSVTGYYNSSTHVYTTQVTVTAPSGRSTTVSSSGTSATAYLPLNLEHGLYGSSSSHVGTCPNVQGGSHPLGGSGTTLQVKQFCSIGPASFNNNVTPSNLTVSVTCSKDGASTTVGSITVKVFSYPVEPVGEWQLENIPSQTEPVPNGGSKQFTFEYKKKEVKTCPCSTKGAALLSKPTGVEFDIAGAAEVRTGTSIVIN